MVNFVMKRDFEGVDIRAQKNGISDFGDAESRFFFGHDRHELRR